MVDKVAVPFWLCWTAGMLIGLVTGDVSLWLIVGAVVGIVAGLMMRAQALRRKRRAFQGAAAALEVRQAPAATNPSGQNRAA